MARSVWKSQWQYIRNDTAQVVERALRHAISQGMTDMNQLCRFIAYYMERNRQDRFTPPIRFWGRCERSKHRYQHGINTDNYLVGGQRIIAAMHRFVGLDKDSPTNAVLDRLMEEKNVTGYKEYKEPKVKEPPKEWCGEGCTCFPKPDSSSASP